MKAAQHLLNYYRPLARFSHGWSGAESLLSPSVNILGANALYADQPLSDETRQAASEWAKQYQVPPLQVVAGESGQAGRLRVGCFVEGGQKSALQVEQLSRLHLPQWAAVLTEAYGQAEWANVTARHLAKQLEYLQQEYVLLMAYAGHEAVGALLWQPCGAHLWGTSDEAADAPLLNAAAQLSGGAVMVSLPDSSPLSSLDEQCVSFEYL